MDNQEYWQRRSLEDAARNINLTEDFINNRLKKYYKETQKEIEQALNDFYKRFADKNNITLAEAKRRLKDLDFDKINFEALSEDAAAISKEIKELKNKLPAETLEVMESYQASLDKMLNAYSQKGQITRLELLNVEIEKTLVKLFGNGQISIYNMLADTYKDSYYRSIYNVQTAFGIGVDFIKPNEAVIQKSVTKSWCKTNYSKKIWGHRKQLAEDLRSHITQGLIQGLSEEEMSKKLAKDLNVSLSNAKRLARTESNYIHNQVSLDTYEEYAGIEKYRFLATLDYKTSPICQDLDGKIFYKEEAQVGVNFPPMHPNCRSTTTVYFDGDEIGTRAARGANGKSYEVPADMTYKEWFDSLEETEQGKMRLKLKNERKRKRKKLAKNQNAAKMDIRDRNSLKIYTKTEIEQMVQETSEIINKYTSNESKWNGKIVVDDEQKKHGIQWSYEILTESETSPHILMHEHLHAHSISYYNREVYREFSNIEEASVQFFNQEISKLENIEIIESGYDEMTDALRNINKILNNGNTNDFEFAKKLFNIPVVKRMDWLEDKGYTLVEKGGSIKECEEFQKNLEIIRSWGK